MGKATILSHDEGGKYLVEIDVGTETIQDWIAELDEEIERLEEEIEEAEEELETANDELLDLLAALDNAINNLNAAITPGQPYPDTGPLIQAATIAIGASAARDTMHQALLYLRADLNAAKLRREQLDDVETSREQEAWCVDLTVDAEGLVDTIEVSGEPELVLIAAGAPEHTPAAGHLVARVAQMPEQAYFNAAVLPGWQRHMPTFRTGTITEINKAINRCNIDLDDAESSAQGLPINEHEELLHVPIDYMTCNAQAFEEDDHVVIDLRDGWDNPKVIGFVEQPRPCCYWPPTPDLPDAGSLMTFHSNQIIDSLRLIRYEKGITNYVRGWPVAEDGSEIPYPEQEWWDDETQTLFIDHRADAAVRAGPTQTIGLGEVQNLDPPEGQADHGAIFAWRVEFIEVSRPLADLASIHILLEMTVVFVEQGGDGRAISRATVFPIPEGATPGPNDFDIRTEGWQTHTSPMTVDVDPTTSDPVWLPDGIWVQATSNSATSNLLIHAHIWIRCIGLY